MKTGANYVILAEIGIDVADVKKVIFTFSGKTKVKKEYPSDDVSVNNGVFAINLYQRDTEALSGDVLVEAQINYFGGAVAKTDLQRRYIGSTLNTEEVDGDMPSQTDLSEIKFDIAGGVVVAKVEATEEAVKEAVDDYLDKHPIQPYDDSALWDAIADLKKYIDEHITPGPVPPTPGPEPEPIPDPEVPEGTWQLKATTEKKYVILGSDDDNSGNAKYFRLLRSYGFPYTMNVEAENANTSRQLGSDVDDFFTAADAPALFPNGVDVITLGKYLHDSGTGEVAQHGASSDTLWDSSKLTGTFLDNLYAEYASQGGTKSKAEMKTAIIEQKSDSDVRNDAPYVERSRKTLESVYGFPILTVGMWGGSPSATVDGIELNLNGIKGGAYDWQGHDYYGASTYVATWHINNSSYDIARMNDGNKDMTEYIDSLPYGKAVEFFWHMPFNDRRNIREMMEDLKRLEDAGDIEIVTRYQYSQLGEYVSNPITGITVSREGSLSVGDVDTDAAYTVTVTYADGTRTVDHDERILDRSAVNTAESGTYTVNANYRGFTANTSVVVNGSSDNYPEELKSQPYWFVYSNDSNGNWYCGNITSSFRRGYISNGVLVFDSTHGFISGWKSSDGGVTWEQVTTNREVYNTTSTTKTSDTGGGFKFDSSWGMKMTWIETSENFEVE